MDTHSTPEQTMTSAEQLAAVRSAVEAMPMARSLGLRVRQLDAGHAELELPYQDELTCAPGMLQATPVYAIADFAAVSAAATTLPQGWVNATSDTTLKLVAPAVGRVLRARGRVISIRRSQTVCAADVFAVNAMGEETLCAVMVATASNRELSAS
ncbi:PaaI family thioesterase [Hydrogenophaga sp. 5NK40-0174]|uniref:PaaI family thioesterase n=1 Tax=Hydrogenophaga sp. 5NK40-0174 TaxID=3127649 RepID=UPI0031047970